MKKILLVIALLIIVGSAFLFGKEQGKQYVLNNQYIETLDCTHGNSNFDYGIYLDDKLMNIYE